MRGGWIVGSLLFVGCVGPVGPQGPPGPQGPTGPQGATGYDAAEALSFDTTVDFTPGSNFETVVAFPDSWVVYNEDVILVYTLAAIEDGADVWEPLPRTLFFGEDVILYGYDFTTSDVRLFVDGTIDPGTIDPGFLDDVIFRVVQLPVFPTP